MSFSGAPMPFMGTQEERRRHMAKQKIRKHTANLVGACQWRWWLRIEITIPWPSGWTPQDHLGNSALSYDPNDWYREWLETNVGPQGWAWNWRGSDNNRLIVKFRDHKAATLFALRWS